MFVLETERLVKNWPATVSIPVDGGSVEDHPITLDLLLLDNAVSVKILQGDEATFKRVIQGWSGISAEENQPLDYSEENLSRLLQNSFFVIAAMRAYQQASSGQAAEKN